VALFGLGVAWLDESPTRIVLGGKATVADRIAGCEARVHRDSKSSKPAAPFEFDGETISLSQASSLAERPGPLVLSRLLELAPATAQILVKHKGRDLSFPAVWRLSAKNAEILAAYDGTLRLDGLTLLMPDAAEKLAEHEGILRLDGLWMLTNVPLATKLALQWRSEGIGAPHANITIAVAEVIDLWPPASEKWPPYRINGFVAGTVGMPEKWEAYRNRRADMIALALVELRAEHALTTDGLDRQRADHFASHVAEVEQRFFITLAPRYPYKKDQVFDYVGTTGDCFGPVSGDKIREVIETLGEECCFYWPCGDPDDDYDWSNKTPTNPIGPSSIQDVRLAEGIRAKSPFIERMSLLLLQGAWQYVGWLRAEYPYFEELATSDFSCLCEQAESLDKTVELAFSLTPQLRKIPWPPSLRDHLFRNLSGLARYAERRQWLGMDESQLRKLEAAIARLRPADGDHSLQ
jgi:hypothetical protein